MSDKLTKPSRALRGMPNWYQVHAIVTAKGVQEIEQMNEYGSSAGEGNLLGCSLLYAFQRADAGTLVLEVPNLHFVVTLVVRERPARLDPNHQIFDDYNAALMCAIMRQRNR